MKNSDVELRQTDINNDYSEPNTSNVSSKSKPKGPNAISEQDQRPTNWLGKIRAAIAFVTIEPFLLCYILPNSISNIAVQRLNLEKACRVDLNHTKEKCDEWDGNITIQIQSMVADMTSWQIPLQSGIPAIVILFVGAWSDRSGNRKLLMLIPMLGELIFAFGLVLTTYYFDEWPLFVTGLIESLPSVLTGGFSIALMGAHSYLADVTSAESRMFRIGISSVIVTLGVPVAISFGEILLDTIGYYAIFGLTTSLYLFGFLYTCFRIHDVNPIEMKGVWYRKLIDFLNPKNVWDTLDIVFKATPNRVKIILIVAAHIVIVGPIYGEGEMIYQYLLFKYKMEDEEISLFFTFSVLVMLCGTAVAITLFSKFLKMHDATIGVIATACNVMAYCVYGLAPTKSWLYSGPAFDFFGGSGFTAIKSMGTKVAEPKQIAKMCSLIGFVDAVAQVIYAPMYRQFYKKTLATLPGAFYLLGGAMTVPALFIFIALYVIYKKEERDKVRNPRNKEIHAHFNYVTSF